MSRNRTQSNYQYSKQYSNRKNLAQSYHPSTPPSLLIRNQSFQIRQNNQQLIQLIAKIRLLEDELLNERFKTQGFERKIHQYQKIIDNMEYQITSQNYQLQKYRHQIQLSNQKNMEIIKYQQNLKYIGEQIEELNNILIRKNHDYQQLFNKQTYLHEDITKLQQANQSFRVVHQAWKKQLDSMLEQWGQKLNKKTQTFKNISKQNQFVSLSADHFNLQIYKQLGSIRQILQKCHTQNKQLQKQQQLTRQQLSLQVIKHKQQFIKLQYEHKLLQGRVKDQQKKQDLVSLCYNEKKADQIIQEMLKKQDQYVQKLDQMQNQIQSLKYYIQQLQGVNNLTENIQSSQKQSIINNLKHQNHILSVDLHQALQQIHIHQTRYQQILSKQADKSHQELDSDLLAMKKLRKLEEQNYQFKIKIQQLLGQINLLTKQVQILRAND